MSLAYLSGFSKWEGFDILPLSFFARFAFVWEGGGHLWPRERMIHLFLERCFLDPTEPL